MTNLGIEYKIADEVFKSTESTKNCEGCTRNCFHLNSNVVCLLGVSAGTREERKLN